MATVTEDLLMEGREILASRNPEDIHRFADRIISVESDNWYGLYMRGCGYALDADLSNCVSNYLGVAENIEDEALASKLLPDMCQMITECIMRQDGSVRMDFGSMGVFINTMNDKLPECDDEVIVSRILEDISEYIGKNTVAAPLIAYYGVKALVVCSFGAYVQLEFFLGFFETLKQVGQTLLPSCDGKSAKLVGGDEGFINAVTGAIRSALEGRSEEEIEKYEDYWLSHKTDSYVAHIMQAYNVSAGVANGGLMAKMAGKLMNTEIQNFIKIYFSAKIE